MEPLRKALQAERYRPRLDELQRDDPPLVPFHWEMAGTVSFSNPSRFASAELVKRLTPVAFPPGRFRLPTKPTSTGSPPIVRPERRGRPDLRAGARLCCVSACSACMRNERNRSCAA
jgi:hypothetical protein